jgi:hypothetical protein
MAITSEAIEVQLSFNTADFQASAIFQLARYLTVLYAVFNPSLVIHLDCKLALATNDKQVRYCAGGTTGTWFFIDQTYAKL